MEQKERYLNKIKNKTKQNNMLKLIVFLVDHMREFDIQYMAPLLLEVCCLILQKQNAEELALVMHEVSSKDK